MTNPVCTFCDKAPGTEKDWRGQYWCKPCLKQALAENDAMCRAAAPRKRSKRR